ncbi:MAG: L,D-transpeptidase family protein [Paracoccaceae bacterium]
MTFAISRRGALRVMTSALASAAVFGANPGMAAGLMSAFTQSLAEAAADSDVVAAFYRDHDYATLWTGAADADRRQVLLNAFDTATAHGLPAQRYDAAQLRAHFGAAQTEGDLGRLEVEMSTAYLAFVRDLSSGALVPSSVSGDIKRVVDRPDAALAMIAATGDAFPDYLDNLAPIAPEYTQLMKEKLALEEVVAAGGYGAQIDAKSVDIGTSGPAVVQLRDRLMAVGYLSRSFSEDYDADIQAAVQRFQLDNGIEGTGEAGEGTVAVLNVEAGQRLKSVVVAMERLRWMGNAPLGERHIWVNQPDFTVKVYDDGKVTFVSRVVIGKVGADTESPEFSDQMEFMVINPTWSVPRSIVVKEYLPMMQRNPNAQGQLQVIDRAGRVVDRASVDFAAYTPGTFPYALRQPPSDGNALGKVKFMFPNQYNIYLHDTPTKSLFAKEVRAFSHGCIRVGSPFDFAYVLLAKQTDDPKGLFKSYLTGGREAVLDLAKPVPVHLVYFTAWPNEQGTISYRRDIYGRDAKVFAALAEAGVVLEGVQS